MPLPTLREYLRKRGTEWLLKRFGLEHMGDYLRVFESKGFCGITIRSLHGYIGVGKLRDEKHESGTAIHESFHALDPSDPPKEPIAYYAMARALSLMGVRTRDYRKMVEEVKKRSIKEIALYYSMLVTIPALSIVGGVKMGSSNLVGAGTALLSILASVGVKTFRHIKEAHEAYEEVRYLRWLLKRGIKKGLRASAEDMRKFVGEREEVLRHVESKRVPRDVEVLAKMLPHVNAPELKEEWLKRVVRLEKLSRVPVIGKWLKKRYERALLAGSPELPKWFLRPSE